MSEQIRGLYIHGREVPAQSGEVRETRNPANNERVARVSWGGPDDVHLAVESAFGAWRAWADMKPVDRGRVLGRIAQLIRDRAEALAELETLDTGKPTWLSRIEVEGSARYFEFYSGLADKFGGETIPLGDGYLSYTRHEPFGVIAEIMPWNLPLNQAARGLAPVLLMGNTAVAKPAELTPLTTLELARIGTEAGLPDGVLNVVTGDGPVVGEALVKHPKVRKVGFTGSVATGRRIAHLAADRLLPAALELGGKSANIVFEDADLAAAIRSIFNGFTQNSGQICSAGTRLLAHRSVHDELVRRLADLAAATTLGPGVANPKLGPLISREQQEKVRGYLRLAVEEGAAVLPASPAAEPAEGWYVAPRVLVGVDNSMRVAQEEIFGPVLSVIPFDDEDEAVAQANDSAFGLAAAVWTRDLARAHRVASRLEAGQVFVNEYFAGGVETPFGGVKESGYGRVKGIEAVRHVTYLKTVIVKL